MKISPPRVVIGEELCLMAGEAECAQLRPGSCAEMEIFGCEAQDRLTGRPEAWKQKRLETARPMMLSPWNRGHIAHITRPVNAFWAWKFLPLSIPTKISVRDLQNTRSSLVKVFG